MAIQHDEPQQRISLEEFFTLLESDPEHRYELIDGYPSLITGGIARSLDHWTQYRKYPPGAVAPTAMHRL